MRLSQYIGDFHPDAQVNGFCGCSLIALICNKYSAIFNAISSFIMSRKTIKVFINNIPLVIINNLKFEFDQDFPVIFQVHHDIFFAIDFIMKNPQHIKDMRGVYFYSLDVELTFKELCKKFKYIEAAGGLVLNNKGKVLMIHRLGVWDLPKGKIDKGETSRKAAVREIEEESGIGKLKIIKSLPPTYHIYTLKGKRILKKTFWFKMTSSDTKKPIPQTEENIDEVSW